MEPTRLPPSRARKGAMMLQFAMFAFGFFALAAVVIDMRLAFVTQQRMQVATDLSALEGMRWRDRFGDVDRRQRARESIELLFDDNYDVSDGDPLQLGAGPLISLQGGQAESNALALVVVDPERSYHPRPQINNTSNAGHGDLVAGTFDPLDTARTEFADYTRTDFTPSGPGAASQAADSFLARLRRSNDLLGLDNLPGVSSAGPTLPLLFGLGSMVIRTPGEAYNPRTDGLTVRSTSIAGARRAVAVSGPGPAAGYPALQRFVLLSPGPNQNWESLAVGEAIWLVVRPDGTLRNFSRPFTPPGPPLLPPGQSFTPPGPPPWAGGPPPGTPVGLFFHTWGRFARRPVPATGLQTDIISLVGDQVVPMTQPPSVPSGETYVPIARDIGGVERVIGFGRISLTHLGGGVIEIVKMRGIVEAGGVSAIDPAPLAALGASPALRAAYASFTEPMLAPVLTR